MEEELDLYRVRVIKLTNNDSDGTVLQDQQAESVNDLEVIQEFPNMISAKVLKGRMVELEHSKLVGDAVKFKTVINFDKVLDAQDSLGVTLVPQKGYINKPDVLETKAN